MCPYSLDGEHRLARERARRREYPFGLCAVFKLHRSCARRSSARGPWKLSSDAAPEGAAEDPVDVSGRPPAGAVRADSLGAPAVAGSPCELPRKEVIQPQLPLRLPCYDFTPITSPTFDGSLPKGLGHRLRVLPAFVV
jgi:hypothetical protein